jgi:hypothetical protein
VPNPSITIRNFFIAVRLPRVQLAEQQQRVEAVQQEAARAVESAGLAAMDASMQLALEAAALEHEQALDDARAEQVCVCVLRMGAPPIRRIGARRVGNQLLRASALALGVSSTHSHQPGAPWCSTLTQHLAISQEALRDALVVTEMRLLAMEEVLERRDAELAESSEAVVSMQASLDRLKGKLADQETLVAELRQYTAAVEADLAAAEASAAAAAMAAAAAEAAVEGRMRESGVEAVDAERRALEMRSLEREAAAAQGDAEAKAAALAEAQQCSAVLEGMLDSMAAELDALRTDIGVKDHVMAKLRTALALPDAGGGGGGDAVSAELDHLVETVEATATRAMAMGVTNLLLWQQLTDKDRTLAELMASQSELRTQLAASVEDFNRLQVRDSRTRSGKKKTLLISSMEEWGGCHLHRALAPSSRDFGFK